jgi:transposase
MRFAPTSAKLGIVTGTGVAKVASLVAIVRDAEDDRLPTAARLALTSLADQIDRLTAEVEALERQLVAAVRCDEEMRQLTAIPGVGPITAAAIKALVPDTPASRPPATSRLGWA